jgi:two-component system sensor histidine kinase MprB
VNELVELARDEGSAEPAERVDLTELVEVAVRRVGPRWPNATFNIALEPVTVTGRPDSLERMVANLLDNAAKWSPAWAPVRVGLRTVTQPARDEPGVSYSWAELTVADSGPGIDEADLPRIFERFYRASSARAMPGSGLGLAIVAQALELHSGTVTAGRSDTGGALFTVRLPGSPPTPTSSSTS